MICSNSSVGYVGCDKILVMFMLAGLGAAYGNIFFKTFSKRMSEHIFLFMKILGGVYSGNQMNHMALSPRHAGTLYGITNAAANTCGFLGNFSFVLLATL